jgi:hypothetical protein
MAMAWSFLGFFGQIRTNAIDILKTAFIISGIKGNEPKKKGGIL